MRYAIVDIETTGSHAKGHGITEIAVIITDGQQELERWETLVNPGVPIPFHITRLTGIDDDMVSSAPPFHQIADELKEWLSDTIFVAHNVGFDYSFIRGHFETLGQTWKSPKLCTVRLARKLLPGHGSYSLGNLCRDLDIANDARHRAMGDCDATLVLFHRMLALPRSEKVIEGMLGRGDRESWLPQHVEAKDFEALPTSPGIYQFLNKAGTPIYIGMSHNVRHRVRSHFSGSMSSERRQAFLRDTYQIVGEATGSVLMARLLEDDLIRQHWPVHNQAQKSVAMRTTVQLYTDRLGYQRFLLKRQRHGQNAIRSFFKGEEAKEWLHGCAREHQLDTDLLGLGTDGVKVTRTQSKEVHNSAMEVILAEAQKMRRLAIIAPGRSENESAVVLIEQGSVVGWGFTEETIERFDSIEDLVEAKKGSGTTDAILEQALKEYEQGTSDIRIWEEPEVNA